MACPTEQTGEANQKKRHHSVLFVCTGNTCRSVIAEAVFKKLLDERGLAGNWTVDSAGTSVGENGGDPPNPEAQKVLSQHGLSGDHRTRNVKLEDGEWFDFILCMEDRHVSLVLHKIPGVNHDKIHLLRKYDKTCEDNNIPDPIGRGTEAYAKVFEICKRACEGFLDSV